MTDAATHIRRLFLEPKKSYSVRDTPEILGRPLPGPQDIKAPPFWFLISGF